MKITGHKTESFYPRQAISSDSNLRDAMARLSRDGDTGRGHLAESDASQTSRFA